MSCFYVKKTKQDDLFFQYGTDDDRVEITSIKNIKQISALVREYFSRRKLKEFESEKDTLDILALRIDSEKYPLFVKALMLELKSRIDYINSDVDLMNMHSVTSQEELDSLQNLIAIQTFLRRYYDLMANKKYKDYTYYIIEPIEI